MRGYRFPRTEQVREVTAERFGGADFSTHATKVSLANSPDMKNMLAGETHFLVKRTGYKRVCKLSAPVYGLFALPNGGGAALLHCGDAFYMLAPSGATTLLCTGAARAFSSAFVMGGKLYVLDGATYRVVAKKDGKFTATAVSNEAFVPTTTISAPPSGGGTPFEAVNLLTPRRINTFIGNGSATQFFLDAKALDEAPAIAVTVGGVAVTWSSVNRETGVVTLTAPPANGNGLANVTIAFSKTTAGYAEKINKCRIAGLYGGKNDTRVFFAGNPDEPACDWQSGLYDPTYFPDTGYTKIGTDAAPIAGYVKQFESQIVIKEGGEQEATQYLRSYLMANDGSALYPLKQGAQGAGAAARRCFATLGDVPMYLSKNGAIGVYGTSVAEQRTMRAASRAIDARLAAEPQLENACAAVHDNRYYLAVNGHCYVADSRVADEEGCPAWYFWDNLPARCFAEIGSELYFGTEDGRVCRMCRPEEAHAYLDDGAAIDAYWCTPVLSLGAWSDYKTLRAFYPVLMPYTRSGAEIRYIADGNERTVFAQNLDLFGFETFDFGRMSFACMPGASPFLVREKLRRCRTVQMRIGNDRADEPFGLLALVMKYTQGNTVK